ncbi:MAG: nitroreductase family protein [Armatimonadetes bacterium]|nr:nitroreductase family protein [Armatimonadota bacterium]
MIEDLVRRNRSYRRFYEERDIDAATLRELVNLARLSASGSNAQPLKYLLSTDRELNHRIFPTLGWAGYLRDWPGPAEGERPGAYIVILGDRRIRNSFGCDHGIAAQSILLGATERGIGGCMIGSVDRNRLREALQLPDHFEILLVIALGYPKEEVVLEDAPPGGDIRYYRDADGVHHVPKRTLDEIIVDMPEAG